MPNFYRLLSQLRHRPKSLQLQSLFKIVLLYPFLWLSIAFLYLYSFGFSVFKCFPVLSKVFLQQLQFAKLTNNYLKTQINTYLYKPILIIQLIACSISSLWKLTIKYFRTTKTSDNNATNSTEKSKRN
eukprot:GHVP01049133.1.p2 GENE.GHVP01049133.1~~GHVP01049133.1.p2  ORF type:complete len:128 (+),score=2.11 GHVP01049133.1:584-967(+)